MATGFVLITTKPGTEHDVRNSLDKIDLFQLLHFNLSLFVLFHLPLHGKLTDKQGEQDER